MSRGKEFVSETPPPISPGNQGKTKMRSRLEERGVLNWLGPGEERGTGTQKS